MQNFHVYDLGDALSGRRDILECAGLKLLVCGTKPHELGFSARLQREFDGMDAWLLCPFVADWVKAEMTKDFQNEWHRVRFPGYQPELTEEQWEEVEEALMADNSYCAIYGELAYRQGFQDGIKIVSELKGLV